MFDLSQAGSKGGRYKIYERLGRFDSNSVNRGCDSDGRCKPLEKDEKNESQDHSSRS